MKRLIAIILVLVMVCSFAVTTYAATNDVEVLCPKCGSAGHCDDVWTEYNYYYTRIWHKFICNNKNCGNVWLTSQDINNITRSPERVAE